MDVSARSRPGSPEPRPLIGRKHLSDDGKEALGYICRSVEIVEEHGGRMRVESQVNAGSAFHFTLPKRERSHS